MSNELIKREAAEIVDGFDGALDGGSVAKGTIIQWDRVKKWHDRDDQPVPSPLLAYNFTHVLRRWVKDENGNVRPDYITDHPLPDPESLNATIPKSEWQIGLNGQPTPPWAMTVVMYFIEVLTGRLFTFQSATTGAHIAADLLHEQVAVKRLMLRGEKVRPIVKMSEGTYPTRKYGPVPRPSFEVIDWHEPEPEPEPKAPELKKPDPGSVALPLPESAPVAAPVTETKLEAASPAKKASKPKAATKPDAKPDDAVDPFFNDAIPY